jgi:hypothetical protein
MQLFSFRLLDVPIEDAFIYRTSLYCWTFDNRLRIYAVGDLEAAVIASDPERGPLISYMLFHSRGLGASPDQVWARDGWRGIPDPSYDSPVDLDADAVPHAEVSVHTESDALLDMLMYYDRLYLATDGGLFSVLPFDPYRPPTSSLNAIQRVSDPCYSAAAGLGAIAASCGPKGLRLVLDDLQWASTAKRTSKASDESIRAEIGYGSVVNHRSRFDNEFLATTVETTRKGPILVSTRKAYMTSAQDEGTTLIDAAREVEYTFWDQGRLVVFDNGATLSVSVTASEDQRQLNRVRNIGVYQHVIDRVISAARVGRYLAVESDESIAFIAGAEARRVETGPIVSMRTYPKSYRYRRLTTATSAKGLWMLGLGE